MAYDADGRLLHPRLLDSYRRRAAILGDYPGGEAEHAQGLTAHYDVVFAAIAAGRFELVRLHRNAEIDDKTLHELERDLDLEELGAIAATS